MLKRDQVFHAKQDKPLLFIVRQLCIKGQLIPFVFFSMMRLPTKC